MEAAKLKDIEIIVEMGTGECDADELKKALEAIPFSSVTLEQNVVRVRKSIGTKSLTYYSFGEEIKKLKSDMESVKRGIDTRNA